MGLPYCSHYCIEYTDTAPYESVTICYAFLFGHRRNVKTPTPCTNLKAISSCYTVATRILSIKEARKWFAICMDVIPERVKQHLTIERIFSKTAYAYTEQVGFIKERYLPEPLRLAPWLKVTLDPNKVTAFDIFAVFTLFRYPQEYPELVAETLQTAKEYPQLSSSNLVALASIGMSNPQHGLLDYCRYHKKTPNYIFNIPTLWEDNYSKFPEVYANTKYKSETLHSVFKYGNTLECLIMENTVESFGELGKNMRKSFVEMNTKC